MHGSVPILFIIFGICNCFNYSGYIEDNCRNCVRLNGTYYKSIYDQAPIDYLCTNNADSIPVGFFVSDYVINEVDCGSIFYRESKNQKINYWIRGQLKIIERNVSATKFSCISFIVAVLLYLFSLILVNFIKRLRVYVFSNWLD